MISITLPNSVTTIGETAFFGCDALERVTYEGTRSQWDQIDIGERNDPLLSAELTVRTALSITWQPVDVTVKNGETAVVSFTAEGDGLTYMWYIKNPGGSKFNLTTTFKSSSYSAEMNETRDGRQLYCVVTDMYGNSVTTDTVTMSMS